MILVLIDRNQTLCLRHEQQNLAAGFHHHVEVVADGKILNGLRQSRVTARVGVIDGGGNTIDLCSLHVLVIVVQKKNLQKPNEQQNSDADADEIHPQAEFDAVTVEFNFRTQICSQLLSALR